MLILRSAHLMARVDPAHGAEILDLIDLSTGRQLLGRPPFSSLTPEGGDLDEAAWTARYRGGWQTVLPNAGNACEVAGERHGFHGAASVEPWKLLSSDQSVAEMSWAGHGLVVRKTVSVSEAVRVEYEIEAQRDGVPVVALEHLTVGTELLDPSVEIDLPVAPCYELDEVDGPTSPPAGCASWPSITLRDGSRERGERWSISEPRSRLYTLHSPPAGWCALRNPARRQGLAIAWDADWFAHCWVWHESRMSGGQWRGATEILALEPATVPHSLGLARALQDGHARVLDAGERIGTWIAVRPFQADGPVQGVDTDGRPRMAAEDIGDE